MAVPEDHSVSAKPGLAGYRAGCRCAKCRAANATAKRQQRDRRKRAEDQAAAEARRKAALRSITPEDSVASEVWAEFADLGDMGLDLEPYRVVETLRVVLRELPGDDPLTRFRKAHALTLAQVLDNPMTPQLYPSATTALRKILDDLSLGAPKPGAAGGDKPADPEGDALIALLGDIASKRAGRGQAAG